jgi:hypothetical protein
MRTKCKSFMNSSMFTCFVCLLVLFIASEASAVTKLRLSMQPTPEAFIVQDMGPCKFRRNSDAYGRFEIQGLYDRPFC